MSEGKVAIVTVHGTGDTAEGADGAKWFQRGSQVSQRLLQHLSSQGIIGEIIPHLWSGANSAWDRERGANKLAARIRGLYKHYDTIHIVGHSHGGNVANDAAVLLKWGLRRNAQREKFDSLTTVGTPFFNVKTGWLQKLAGILFLMIAWGSVIVFHTKSICSDNTIIYSNLRTTAIMDSVGRICNRETINAYCDVWVSEIGSLDAIMVG